MQQFKAILFEAIGIPAITILMPIAIFTKTSVLNLTYAPNAIEGLATISG